ncbi:hypothetical protein [Actinomadura sp. SCN-SB]|uniref:hypothetical protein n=1 Tax=Actinomadura sp. SCN-SB TaxID=3373092 RepID=UPI00374FFC22
MRLSIRPRHVPGRVTTGAFILNSGLEKWGAAEEAAQGYHGMAVGAFPFLEKVPPARFLRLLSITEIVVGSVVLAPFVPSAVAGAALTGFSGGLVGLYLRAPGLRKPGSIFPTQSGVPIFKDFWMLGIGLNLIADAIEHR